MKKTIINQLLIFVLLAVSCTKTTQHQENLATLNSNESVIKIVINSAAPNGVLHFKTKEEFERVAESVKNVQLNLRSIIPENFRSLSNLLSDFKKTGKVDCENTFIKHFKLEANNTASSASAIASMSTDQNVETGSMDDFIASSYESLVPDDVFQQFLNEELQIMVGTSLYQVTPVGTFEVQLYNIDYFSGWIATNSISIWTNPGFVIPGENLISDGLYQVSPGIIRQDIADLSTIASQNQNTVLQPIVLDPPTAGPNPAGPEIPMSLVTADKFGEGRGIVGMSGNRRFNFHSYNNGYIIWNSVGIEGKVQRLRRVLWMSYWGQSFADEIIVGADNLDLETDYFFPTPQTMAAMQMAFPKFKGLKKVKLGNHVANYMAFVLGDKGLGFASPTSVIAQNDIYRFTNGFLNSPITTNLVNNVMKNIIPGVIDQYVDPTYKDRYKNEPAYITSYKEITNQTLVRFTAAQVYKKQGYSDNNNWRFDWNLMVSSEGEAPYKYEMKSGNFIGKARIGDSWVGVRVVKYKE